jgi:ubiquinone/menaquinone biosynthesis C-methylase UbiE
MQPGVGPAGSGSIWADLGAGDGAFTLALAELLGPGATIYAVDRDRRALEWGAAELSRRYPAIKSFPTVADFSESLDLPPLDGIVMANALHFVRRKELLLARLRGYLKPGGRFLIVEYNADRGNLWVPHPLSYPTWAELARRAGFSRVELLGRVPSRFLGEIYSSLAIADN